MLNQIGTPYWRRLRAFVANEGMQGDIRREFAADLLERRLVWRLGNPEARGALWWWTKFLLLPSSLRFYSHLFPSDPSRLCADITPNYYYVAEDLIAALSRCIPDTRILFILRDPVERCWSYTKMALPAVAGKTLDEITESEFRLYFDHLMQWWKPYRATLELWGRYFPRVHVQYYDALVEDPVEFYRGICAFAGLEPCAAPSQLARVVNKGERHPLTDTLRQYLSRQYLDEVRDFAVWNDTAYARAWLARLEEGAALVSNRQDRAL